MDVPLDWLLEGEPWVVYRVRLDLLEQPEADPDVQVARQAMLANVQIRSLEQELATWPGGPISNHKAAGQPLHKLTFLADLKLRADDPGVKPIFDRLMEHCSAEGCCEC